MKEYLTMVGSLMGVWAFCQNLLHALFPPELRLAAVGFLQRLFSHYFSSYCYYDITEIDGVNTNELYNAVQVYLSSSASTAGTRLSLTRGLNSSSITFGLSSNDRLVDYYRGVIVEWEHVVTERLNQNFTWRPIPDEKRGFILRVGKRDKHLVLNSYLDYVMDKAEELRRKSQERLLYTNSRGGSLDSRGRPWDSVPFKHPSTFDTLAMDPDRKAEIIADLDDFDRGELFYQKTGRAWKRGYLLYGPPGTGKSSMIAAMANYLCYDIYDLELTEVRTNSELRKLLMKTTSKSIIVIEDIDCSLNLNKRSKFSGEAKRHGGGGGCSDFIAAGDDDCGDTITLSGLLNFTDGLWSCCGSERIFVFTTNYVEKLDPALLRSGRMDMHIHMSYCSFPALMILMKNYLGTGESDLPEELREELEAVMGAAEMTPADISEILIRNRRDGKAAAVGDLLAVLKSRAEMKSGKWTIGNGSGAEDEEQEKRALDYPNKNGDTEDDHLYTTAK